MGRKIIVMKLILVFLCGCGKKGRKEVLPLSPSEIKEAIRYGEDNASLTYNEFVSPWTVDLGYEQGYGKATILTPFLRVALLGKRAKEMHKEVDMKIINLALKEEIGKIHFKVTLYGDYPTFGRTVKFILKYNDKEIKPVFSYMAPYSQFTRDYYHISEGEVKFEKGNIPKDAKVVLVTIFKPRENEEEKKCEFEFDLSKYR